MCTMHGCPSVDMAMTFISSGTLLGKQIVFPSWRWTIPVVNKWRSNSPDFLELPTLRILFPFVFPCNVTPVRASNISLAWTKKGSLSAQMANPRPDSWNFLISSTNWKKWKKKERLLGKGLVWESWSRWSRLRRIRGFCRENPFRRSLRGR